MRWQVAAFHQILDSHRELLGCRRPRTPADLTDAPAAPVNLISIGDGLYEQIAARVCGQEHDIIKTVKFIDEPTIADLRSELCKMGEMLPALVRPSL
jgi:hypothetical protein